MKKVRVGLVGSQFVSTIHAEALKRVPEAELFAVTSPSGDNAERFAKKHGVRHHFRDYRKMIEAGELDVVVLGCPNDLHCEFTELAAFLTTHHTAAQDTTDMVHFYQNATGGFATAAAKVSQQYRQSDAFASARVGDVEAAFRDTSVIDPKTPGEPAPPAGPGSEPRSTTELP